MMPFSQDTPQAVFALAYMTVVRLRRVPVHSLDPDLVLAPGNLLDPWDLHLASSSRPFLLGPCFDLHRSSLGSAADAKVQGSLLDPEASFEHLHMTPLDLARPWDLV